MYRSRDETNGMLIKWLTRTAAAYLSNNHGRVAVMLIVIVFESLHDGSEPAFRGGKIKSFEELV